MTIVSKQCPCSGKYGKSLDIKFSDQCNGKCAFCIEKGDRKTKKELKSATLAKKANLDKYDSVLLLGGEPLMNPNLLLFLEAYRKISDTPLYITTNGFYLTPELAQKLCRYITGINISLHHYNSIKQHEIMGFDQDSDRLRLSILVFAIHNIPVRINCNLIQGYIENWNEVRQMLIYAISLGAKQIRFAELQGQPELWVDSRFIWMLPEDPFVDGCEHEVFHDGFDKIQIFVRMTCGLINDKRPCVNSPEDRHPNTDVLYLDGHVGHWGSPIGCHEKIEKSYGGCHHSTQNPDPGCH
jgi:prepilin-type processing-associated H-X9-DG protein